MRKKRAEGSELIWEDKEFFAALRLCGKKEVSR
jgi:hypothetical protein